MAYAYTREVIEELAAHGLRPQEDTGPRVLRDALRDLLRAGVDNRGGMDRLLERIRRMRAQARRRGDLGGTLDQVRAALDQALSAEREALAAAADDQARLAEMELATLPDDVAGAVRALADYDWRSDEARATYQAIQEMLRREVLDAQFAGMKSALESPDGEAMQRVKDMLADLNSLLAAHARQEDTTDQFADFMAKHGEFFPEQPENVDELIDALARRQAAAQRMLSSLTPEQRQQLGQLISQAMADADLASEIAPQGCDRMVSRSAIATPSRRWQRLRILRLWRRSCRRPTLAAAWTMSTSTCWNSGSDRKRPATCAPCAISNGSWNGRVT